MIPSVSRPGAKRLLVAVLLLLLAPPSHAQPAESAAGTPKEPEAVVAARGGLREAEAASGERSLEAARACDALVAALLDAGDTADPETRALARRALETKEALLGKDHPDLAPSLRQLAEIDLEARDLDAARTGLERALAIQESALGPDDPDVAVTLRALANVARYAGRYDEGLELSRRAVAIQEKAFGPESIEVATTLASQAVLLRALSDYDAALPVVERALKIREARLGPDHADVARSLGELAILRFYTGDRDGARDAAARSVETLEKVHGPDHPLVARALDILAMASQDPEESRACWERSIAIMEKRLGPDSPQLANPYNNLGLHLLLRLGRPEEAMPWLEKALRLQQRVLGEDNPDLAKYQINVASAMLTAGQAERAIPILESSQKIEEKALGPDNPDLAISHDWLSRARRRTGDNGRAFEDALEAESIARDHFVHTAHGMAEGDALDYAKARPRGLDVAVALALEVGAPDAPPERAWDAVIRSRALVLDEVAARRRVAGRLDSLRARWERATEEQSSLEARGVTDPDTVATASERREAAERELARAIAKARGPAREGPGLDEVRAALPERTALVAYSVFRHPGPVGTTPSSAGPEHGVPHYAAFVLPSADGPVRVIALGPAAAVDSLTAEVRELSREGTPEADFRAAAAALRELVWDPLEIERGSVDRVLVVPDGSLGLVNFATLPRAEGDGYLVEEPFAIHTLSTERDVVSDEPASGRGLLAVGGADHDADVLLAAADAPSAPVAAGLRGGRSGCPDLARTRFGPLPGTKVEVERIGNLWRDAVDDDVLVLTGAAAREETFERRAPGRRVVHLATHGFFLGPDCRSASDGDRGVTGTAPLAASPEGPAADALSPDNPLITSGLALAGANGRSSMTRGEEDGILTAEEVASLDLSGVEWVVLSGCDTGRGRVQAGEGVLGLRRAFRVAGARTLIMSLWPVSDERTVDWMTELYRARFREGASTAQAVRTACVRLLEKRRAAGESTHPFSWGAFVAAGDWR